MSAKPIKTVKRACTMIRVNEIGLGQKNTTLELD